MKFYTVRLAHRDRGLAITYTSVLGSDADEAAAAAVRKAEIECGGSGFVLDGPVEQENV